jgi:ubiquinone biosynthesis protein
VQRDRLVDMLIALVREDFAAVAKVFWNIGIHGSEATRDYDAFETDVVDCLERRFAGKTVEEIEISTFFRDLVGLALKHRIRMPPDYTMTFKAVVTMEGVVKQLVPERDIVASLRPYVTTLVAERYSPRRLAQNAYETLRDLSETLSGLPAASRTVLEDIRQGRAQLNVEVGRLQDLQQAYVAAQQRNNVALLAAASAVSGTLALAFDKYTVLGFPAVSFWFYVAAVGLVANYIISGRGKA